MAITFRGTVKSPIQLGNNSATQNVFTIENGYQSRVNVNLRRLALQNDSVVALTVVQPLVKVSRATAISGGVILEKNKFDIAQTSDANLIFRSQVGETAYITATPGNIVWQQFTNRMHTAVEQQQGLDCSLLPYLIRDTGKEFKLRPGEALLCQVVAAIGTSNSILMTNYFVECAFEEDAISTFSISGTVTLSGSPVDGAKIMVIEADDVLLTNAFLHEVITTPAGGTWASTIRTGKVGAAFVQYKSGATYYTAPGSPYLES